MLGASKLAIWIITGLFAVCTVFFNLFILLSSLSHYQHTKQWSPSETIVVALSSANLVHQLICYLWMTMDEIDNECHIPSLPYSILLVLIFCFKFIMVWYVSFLTCYYSIKLVHTPNRCYTTIHAIILRHVTLGVTLIPLCAFAVCMPTLVVFQSEKTRNITIINQDCGIKTPETFAARVYEVMALLLADVFPGLLMIKCCISISVHLATHLRHMKASTNGAHGPKLGSQLRVIQMALSLVTVFLVFLVVDLYVNYQIAVYHENAVMLTFLFTSIFTTVTPMVLIYGKTSFWKLFLHEFNTGLDEYPCLSGLKVREQKAERRSPVKYKK
ncbi:uncharacterized protein LOC117376116 [Periophthalmus magnuspinnatus]|uniref:Taste receptor type 2 n=1 Tax=Periophthalmus magnuspinnatus TaxID=409849 RepID=A0A3B4BIZ5_9GOBI|nr:uncharacterized protein LOC117376116 [Periophthalmus magnuspinnatus]